jgi:hypothetical protein
MNMHGHGFRPNPDFEVQLMGNGGNDVTHVAVHNMANCRAGRDPGGNLAGGPKPKESPCPYV